MNLSASWWKISHDTGRTASCSIHHFCYLHLAWYSGRHVFLVVVEMIDFQGIFVDSFALGFGIATAASVVGMALAFIKRLIRSASDTREDI